MRDTILSEIRRLAETNGGQPPGRRLFESETGITEGAWFGKYWARWGDAIAEAGYKPNTKNEKLDEHYVFLKLVAACRHFGKFPATMDLRLYKKIDPDFPESKTIYSRYGGKDNLLQRFLEWTKSQDDCQDIEVFLSAFADNSSEPLKQTRRDGLVYLIKSGAHYKIGRSDELERRVKEIKVALPESATLVHAIRTDDPPGIEAYWHRRFADRRANGEWFKLSISDVAVFKRRKFQ